LIGEGLEDEEKPSNILGGVLSIRGKRDIIEIWVRDGKDEDLKIQIGEKIRDALSLNPNNLTFYFKVNSKSLIVSIFGGLFSKKYLGQIHAQGC